MLIIFLKDFVFFSGHFSKFSRKKYMEKFFLVELHVALLKKGSLIDASCRNISQFFLIGFSKSTQALLLLKHFDNSSKWIVSEVAIQRCSLKLVVPGPRKITYNFNKIRVNKLKMGRYLVKLQLTCRPTTYLLTLL